MEVESISADNLRTRIQAAKCRVRNLEEELKSKASMDAILSANKKLSYKISKLETRLKKDSSLCDRINHMEALVSDSASKLDDLNSSYLEATERLQSTQQLYLDSLKEKSMLTSQLESLSNSSIDGDDSYKSDNSSMESEISSLRTSVLQISGLTKEVQAQIQSLQHRPPPTALDQLRSEIHRESDLSNYLSEKLNSIIRSNHSEISSLKETVQSLQSKSSESCSECRSNLEEENRSLMEENERLGAQFHEAVSKQLSSALQNCSEIQNDSNEMKLAHFNFDVASQQNHLLRHKIFILENQILDLQHQSDLLGGTQSLQKMCREMDNVQNGVKAMKSKIAAYDEQAGEAEELQGIVNKLNKEITEMKNKIDNDKKKDIRASGSEDYKTLFIKVENLQIEVNDERSKMDEKEETIKALKKDNEDLEAKIKKKKKNSEELKNQIEKIGHEEIGMTADRLRSRNMMLEERIKKIEQQYGLGEQREYTKLEDEDIDGDWIDEDEVISDDFISDEAEVDKM